MAALGLDMAKDFSTFPFLGNVGTVSLPITAAIADEREFLQPGDYVAFIGVGSGLNCYVLGWNGNLPAHQRPGHFHKGI